MNRRDAIKVAIGAVGVAALPSVAQAGTFTTITYDYEPQEPFCTAVGYGPVCKTKLSDPMLWEVTAAYSDGSQFTFVTTKYAPGFVGDMIGKPLRVWHSGMVWRAYCA